jgi:hypothetical protein
MQADTLKWDLNIAEIARDRISQSNQSGLIRHFDVQTTFLRPKEDLALLTYYREIELQMVRLVIGWLPTVESFQLKADIAHQNHRIMEIAKLFSGTKIDSIAIVWIGEIQVLATILEYGTSKGLWITPDEVHEEKDAAVLHFGSVH